MKLIDWLLVWRFTPRQQYVNHKTGVCIFTALLRFFVPSFDIDFELKYTVNCNRIFFKVFTDKKPEDQTKTGTIRPAKIDNISKDGKPI